MSFSALCGWTPNPDEVEAVLKTMPRPFFSQAVEISYEKKDTFLYDMVRKVKGSDLDAGPQKIGDCTSWGWAGGVDVVACKQIFKKLMAENLVTLPDPEDTENVLKRKRIVEVFEETATEAMYALGRCEVGKQWNSNSDGGVGAWMAKAVTDFGTMSRPALQRAGLDPKYSGARAKLWGAKGLPDNLEPTAKQHLIKATSLVKSFDEAAVSIINFWNPVIVCSNQGFTMKRDTQGFCSASGTWYHCMKFDAVRFDRPGLLCNQSWGVETPSGPLMFNQPTNSFWVDAKTCDYMLKQSDSFTLNDLEGYVKEEEDVPFSWAH